MTIGVCFKQKGIYGGKEYNYTLAGGETAPSVGSIIRMMDEKYDYICNGTRVKVTSLTETSEDGLIPIRYVKSEEDGRGCE